MKIKHGLAAAAALAFLFITGVQTFAASPGRVSYQGTLRKNGVLFSGTAAMEFRVTNADGSVVYWTSGSTDVVVSTGLFRYGLGSPDEAGFAAIVWKEITPYVQMNLDGGWLPREPLYTSVYSLHAKTAESSTGTFTINGGDLRLTAASGSKGIYFQDGTAQYSAPGWAVTGSYTSFAGGAGVGTLTPATRLDVKGAVADPYIQFWRDENGVVKATMTAAGLLYADGSQLSNLPAGADNMGNHTATTALLMANLPINNAGAITANGQITTYSSATVASPLGLSVPKVRLANGVELSSYSASGLFISSNVTLAAGGRYFGNGSMLSGVNDSLGTHIATQTLNMAGNQILNVSTVVVTRALWFNSNVEISSAAGAYSGVYISTNVNLAAGARYYGDGSGLSGIVGVDNLGNHTMTQGLATGANWISYDGTANSGLNLDSQGHLGIGQAAGSAGLDVRGVVNNYIQIWRNNSGAIQSSMTASGVLYADGSQLRNLKAGGTASQALNMASFNITGVSTMTVSSITSSGIGVVFSTNVLLMNGRLGINTSLPQESLDVNGNFKSSSLAGFGNQCVYADNTGRLLLSGGGLCGSAAGTDNLGNRIMLDNLITGSNWISFDGSNGGLSVNVSSNVGIGVLSAATRLDVQARSGDTYAQIWRNSAGVIQASMTAAGILYADASRMVNLPSGGDSFGNHTATQAVNMGGNQLLNVSSVTVTGASGVGAAKLTLNTNVEISSETAIALGAGVRVSTNIYVVGFSSAAKYYGDGSALTGVLASPDNLGNHTATLMFNMSGNDIIGVSTITLSSVTSPGIGVVFSTNVLVMRGNLGVNTALPQASLDVNGTIMSSSLSGAGNNCVYADPTGQLQLAAGPCGSAAGLDNLGNHKLQQTLEIGGNLISYGPGTAGGGLSVNISSNVGIGILSAATRLDVQPDTGDPYAQIWRNSAGVIQASMSATGELYVDASSMRNLPSGADNLGNHTASLNLNMSGKDIVGVSTITLSSVTSSGIGVVFSTNVLVTNGRLGVNTAFPQQSLDVNGNIMSSSLSGFGDRCVTADNTGKLYLAGDACGTVAGNDNMGNGIMTTNVQTGSNWISYDGFDKGIRLDSVSNVSIGADVADVPGARLDVRGAAGTLIQVWRDVNGTVRASLSSGGGLAASSATVNGQLTVYSSATVTSAFGVGSARLRLSSNVEISSETSASFGGGVRISSNVYIVGFSSAAKYYGDGSSLTGLSGLSGLNAANITVGTLADARLSANVPLLDSVNTFSSSLTVTGAGGARLARISFNDAVEFSSAAAANHGGVQFSTNVYLPAGAKYYGDGSQLSNVSGSDNLGDHTATAALQMAGFAISNAGPITSYSSTTVAGELGVGAALRFDNNVSISSSAAAFNGGIYVSTNIYIVGIASATKYYGDGSGLYGVTGDNIIDTLSATLGAGSDAGGASITNVGSLAAGGDLVSGGYLTAGGPVTTYSSATVAGALGLGAARLSLNANIEISSEASAALGGGVRVSSNVYIVGFSSASKYYGDGSALTGISDDLGNHTAAASLNMASFDITSVSTITVSSITSAGVGVVFSTNVLVMNGGRLGINTESPQESLDVNGNVKSSSLSGFGNQCVYADDTGRLLLAGTGLCGSATGLDNLGNRIMLGNLITGSNWISFDGSDGGLSVNISSNVGVGILSAATRLDVQSRAGDAHAQIWRDAGGAIVSSMSASGILMAARFVGDGSGLTSLPALTDNLVTGSFWVSDNGGNEGIFIGAGGKVGVGTNDPQASLDVKASGVYAQFWRDSGDFAVATMTAEGVLSVSSNVYIVGFSSAAKYYGDGSGLFNLPDGLGSHIATQDLNLAGFNLLNTLVISGAAGAPVSFSTSVTIGGNIGASGGAVFSGGPVGIGTNFPLTSLHISSAAGYAGNMVIISTGITPVITMTGAGEIYAARFFGDGSALTGIAGGGSLLSILAASGNAGNGYIVSLSSLAIGRATGDVALDVQQTSGGDIRIQKWRDVGGNELASMREDGGLYLNSVEISSRLAVGNGVGTDPAIISVILGGFDDANIMNEADGFNAAVFGVSFVNPTQPRTGLELVIGGSFIGGIEAGNTFSFPTLMGLKTSALSQTAATVTDAYGLYVQNEQTAGTILNNYGIDIKQPNAIQITNNYGLMVRDQFIGTSLSYNIYSEGPDAVNLFEGIVVSSGGVKVNTTKAQPACILANRGLFWVVQGGAGVKDLVQVCAKDELNAYAWRTLY